MKNITIRNLIRVCEGSLYLSGRPVSIEDAAGREGEKASDVADRRMEKEADAAGREMEKAPADVPLTDREAAGVVLDSRQVEPGFLFVAVKGERTDGHRFISQVFEKGALAVLCEHVPKDAAGPCILVKDSLTALQKAAAFYRSQIPQVRIVGVTGSVGKTSTKEFVSSVLSQKYVTYKTDKNFNNEIGVPLTLFRIREEHQAAVIEMGINHFGEMHRLSAMVQPDICLLTNIGQCHLEYLGSRDGILKAKSEIFDFMKEDGFVCVNGDDDKLCTIAQVKGRAPVRFGFDAERNDIYATNYEEQGLLGSTAILHQKGEEPFAVRIPLPGRHMVYNALAAAAVGRLFGISGDEIARGIEAVQPVEGRSRILRTRDYVVIDDCYNANPVSMMAALDLLSTAKGRKVAVLGDMFELGAEEEKLHAQVGAYAVEKGIDCIYCAGKLSGALYQSALAAAGKRADAKGSMPELEYFETKEALLAGLPRLLAPGDAVLVKASHGMGYGEVVEALTAER